MKAITAVFSLVIVCLSLTNIALGQSTQAGDRKVLTIDGVSYALRWCPPGTFMMGSPTGESQRSDDETPFRVTLTKGFWMLETEVTQEMWKSVMGDNPSTFTNTLRLPVENVSLGDCEKFTTKLNEKSAANGLKFAVPTEAQWEYACRAGTTTPFHFGSALNGEKANCIGKTPYGTETKGPYVEQTTVVGSYPANAWGLFDMHGNVSEWCSDRYDAYPEGSAKDPTGPKKNVVFRVRRGGSWCSNAQFCRAAFRLGGDPYNRFGFLGFRVCLVSE